jgi:hypothetical protein
MSYPSPRLAVIDRRLFIFVSLLPSDQGCQMACFLTQNPNLGKFWKALYWKMFIHFMAIWNILWRFGIFYDNLVYFVFIWYIFSGFGVMHQEESGNPASDQRT